ncbi:hypothetical protein KP509_18G069900 [Ceratopteris richardii]|uniref:Uncharacterized protein n=1 Tax=Ceratopteris richardii TaxID=49495 RepID=A0A8T2SRD4_CERRI|nr:hypothetical protein KP509_18G069900 [Ceratopteris richardii]
MGKEAHTNGAAANDCSTSAAIAAAREAARILQPPEPPQPLAHHLEALIEAMIFNCRFLTLFAVIGSLGGSVLCFMQGCRFVKQSFFDYVHHTICGLDTSHVVILLVEAIDIFLVATVMMIFGMGVYELFINNIGIQNEDEGFLSTGHAKKHAISNLFGLFKIEVRPSWLEIRSLHELKTKVGHLVVMILLVGMFENSKKVPLKTGFDLLCFSGSILFASSCLYLLSKLNVK